MYWCPRIIGKYRKCLPLRILVCQAARLRRYVYYLLNPICHLDKCNSIPFCSHPSVGLTLFPSRL